MTCVNEYSQFSKILLIILSIVILLKSLPETAVYLICH